MKNLFKIKQGGVLGRNLKHAQKIKAIGVMIMLIAFSFNALAFMTSPAKHAFKTEQNQADAGAAAIAIGIMVAAKFLKDGKFNELKGADLEAFMKDAEPEQISSYFETLATHRKAELEKLIADKADKTVIEDMIKSSNEAYAEQMKALNETMKQYGLQIKKLSEGGATGDISISLKAQLASNKESLKAIAKGISSAEVVIKTLVQRSDIANNQQAYDLPDIGQLATRRLSLYDLFPKLNIGESNNNGVIRYYDWDEDTIARAAAAVAEGGTFQASTAKFKKGAVTLQKIGDSLPVTEEFFEDELMFAAELGLFLETNVNLEIDRQLFAGDGTGDQIVGLFSSINAYTLPGAGTITDPSIYDLIVKVSEQITSAGGSKYMPDFAVMNIVDINRMKLKKDANNNYVLPPFVSRDGVQVAAITVIESNVITANQMALGDRRFARIYEKGGVVLSKGLVNGQFLDDEMTLKARKRLAFLIRSADKGGFRKVTDIDAALVALKVV